MKAFYLFCAKFFAKPYDYHAIIQAMIGVLSVANSPFKARRAPRS
jgi:hypothetical protein